MKRSILIVAAVLGLLMAVQPAFAGWGHLSYSGYQPWWNIFAKRPRCMSPEEERLQKFWHDYYHAMKEYYCALDHIDWVAYYKNHGYQINGACGMGGCTNRINYAPVFVSPMMQWAMPSSCFGGVPCGSPMGGPPMGGPPMGGPMGGPPMGGPMPGFGGY